MTLLTSGELQLKSDTADIFKTRKKSPIEVSMETGRLEKTSSCPDSSWLRLQQEEERGHVEECQDYVRTYCVSSPDDSSSGFLTAASFIADFIFRNKMKSWLLLASFQSRGMYLTSKSKSHVEVKVGAFCGFYRLRSLW